MHVIGIDPGATTGIAVLEHGTGSPRLVEHWSAVSLTGRRVAHLIEDEIARARRLTDEDHTVPVAIEDQHYVDNPRTLIALVESRARWQQVAESYCHPVTLVQPSTWRTVLRGMPGLVGRATKRAVWKAAAVEWVRLTFRVEVFEDEADAICIAWWLACEMRMRGRSAA